MTDSPTSQAMHLAMTELKEREQRIAELAEALREVMACTDGRLPSHIGQDRAYSIARSVLNKETNRG